MSGGVVCYIERTPGGSGIARLRLIAAGLVRQWSAPEARSVSSVDAGGEGPSVATARAGATWIAETLASVGLKRLAAVCVDAEGSICAWLSAPSPDPTVVRATIVQSGVDGDGSGAGVGAARLLTGADGGSGGGSDMTAQTSLQALATIEPEDEDAKPQGLAGVKNKLTLRKAAPVGPIRKQRYAVLAVQDAVVRVLLDELDAKGIEVERAMSVWHAMAGAWDRSAAASLSDRLVSADPHGAAVILVEPTGRLIWAWTKAGELVAGGTMRLATHARRAGSPAPAAPTVSASESDALAAPLGPDAARRAAPAMDADDGSGGTLLEFTPAEAGRLAMDWLAWSAQLGHCPQRVVCLSAPNLTDEPSHGPGSGGGLGPEALFAHLAKSWPGATVDGAVHEDPIGATIARVAGLGPEQEKAVEPSRNGEVLPYHERPREALVELSARPGRADRRMFQSIGIALCASALLIGVLGWRVRTSIASADAELNRAREARVKALSEAEKYSTGIGKHPKPIDQLKAALQRVQDQEKQLKTPRPVLNEAVRVLTALKDVNANVKDEPAPASTAGAAPDPTKPGVPGGPGPGGAPTSAVVTPPSNKTILNELEFTTFAATAKLSVPDAATGPTILDKLTQTPGVLEWSGSTSMGYGGAPGGPGGRAYILTATWPDDLKVRQPKARASGPGPSAGADKPGEKPADKPSDRPAEKPIPMKETAPPGSPDGPPATAPGTPPAPPAGGAPAPSAPAPNAADRKPSPGPQADDEKAGAPQPAPMPKPREGKS